MANSEGMYVKISEESAPAQRSTGSRALKVVALLGGSCLVLLSFTAVSVRNPVPETSLFGVPTSLRSAKPSSALLPQMTVKQIPGPSPWKELALAGIEAANNQCGRDVSMKANPVRSVVENMNSEQRTALARAEQTFVSKMSDIKAGQTAPFGFFDPFGISTSVNGNPGKLLFYREAELKHGRICMLASLGFLVGENFHPLFGGNIDVPSYLAFQQTPLETFWYIVAIVIAIPEAAFSIPTFKDPKDGTFKTKDTFAMLSLNTKDGTERIPGDLGYDPLNIRPKDPTKLLEMQNKELNNGRLAMIGMAGMVAQELVSGQKVLDYFKK